MSFESYFNTISGELSTAIINFKKKYPDTKDNFYPEELINVFDKYIEVYGHAFCMDVSSERKKISKLLYRMLNELKH